MLGDGNTTLEEEYLKAVGQVGLRTAKSKIDSEQSAGILAQQNQLKNALPESLLMRKQLYDEIPAHLRRFGEGYKNS